MKTTPKDIREWKELFAKHGDKLPERWHTILSRILAGDRIREIGRDHGITHTRVRQLRDSALLHMRKSEYYTVGHLKKVAVIEVEYNEHLGTYGARCLMPQSIDAPLNNTGSIGGATIIQTEEWIVDVARALHITVPGILRETANGKKK